jgi:PEP-CTERM motif-containing protein
VVQCKRLNRTQSHRDGDGRQRPASRHFDWTSHGKLDAGRIDGPIWQSRRLVGAGNFFLIGTSFSGVAPAGGGDLLLWFFDQNNSDNTEHITATVTTDSVGGVPEPSTWAMMILGFFGIGFVAHRKRKSGLALSAA